MLDTYAYKLCSCVDRHFVNWWKIFSRQNTGKNAITEEQELLNKNPGKRVLSSSCELFLNRPGIGCYIERSYCSDVSIINHTPCRFGVIQSCGVKDFMR